MSSLASVAFLNHLKTLYPESARYNPWYIIAAVGYAASNRPEAIPNVLQHAMKEIEGSGQEEKLLLVNRLRDAIFKGGLINGYPRAINGLKELYDATPTELRDTTLKRDITLSNSEIAEKGRAFYRQTYGVTSDSVQSLLDGIYPDMGWFSNFVGYGMVYSYSGLLTPLETSYVLCTALIATDTMRETDWHLKGAMRNGATVEGINSVKDMAVEVAKECGVVWRNKIPEIKPLQE